MASTKKETEQKQQSISIAMSQIERLYGKGAIMHMGTDKVVDVDVISSGNIGLDIALGVGGFPRGRIIEIYGPEASGKTTLALHAVAEVQKNGGIAAYIDAEHALDMRYARLIGVQSKELLLSQPDYGEQALEIVEILVRSGAVDIVVVDSVAALVPKNELEGNMGDAHMAQQARLMSQALRKLTAVISKSKTMVVFINQLRMKVGVVFGNPETTTGGNALKFYSTMRLDVRKISAIKEGDLIVGARIRIKVVKNKVAPPFRQVECDIMHTEGISYSGSLLDMSLEAEVIQKSGTWFSFDGQRIGQGRENAKQFLVAQPAIREKLEKLVREKYKLNKNAPLNDPPAEQAVEVKASEPDVKDDRKVVGG